MKKINCFLFSLFMILSAPAQQIVDLQENQAHVNNGIEYGYYVTNEQSKEVKGEEYDRYELELYATNKSGCVKLFPLRNTVLGSGTNENNLVANFTCKNATGKRLTAKTGKLEAQPWYANVVLPGATQSGNQTQTVQAMVGYALRNGQTITRKIIVIVPKGERPKINCRIVFIPDMN
jgi:hypothetical protein